MAIPASYGINHGSDGPGTNWETGDLQYLWNQGFRRIRLNIVQYDPVTYPSSNLSAWRTHTQSALNMGYYTVYGLTAGGQLGNYLTQASWNTFAAQVRQEAAWAQAQNNPNLEFQIGNEEEAHHYVPINSLTQTGGLATATTLQPHTYTSGETVAIKNVNHSGYFGDFTITVTSATTFTFAVSAATPSPDGSTDILSTDLTPTQIRALVRANATAVKSIYTVGPISYASSLTPDTSITDWAAEGIGALDKIAFNVYGYGAAPRATFQLCLDQMVAGFAPGTAYVSEWSTGNGYLDYANEVAWAAEIAAREKIIKASGLDAYYFAFMSDQWGIKRSTGDFRYAWPVQLGQRRWFQGSTNSPLDTRVATPVRTTSLDRPSTSLRDNL